MNFRTQSNFQELVKDRLRHIANRVHELHDRGEHDLAHFLQAEGMDLAMSYDNGNLFWVGKIADSH